MRILFAVHQFFPKHYTGTERLVLNLCKQMRRMGHYVEVLTYSMTAEDGFKRHGDLLVNEYEYQGIPVISIKHAIMPDEVSFPVFDDGINEILDGMVARRHYDIVHVCHPMRVGSVIRSAKRCNIPVVLTLTDFWLMCPKGIAVAQNGELCLSSDNGTRCVKDCFGPMWQDRLKQRFNDTKEVFKSVDCVTAATNFMQAVFKTNNFTSAVKLIRFGTDYIDVRENKNTYSPGSNITIGFLSTLLPHKGAHVLLEAFNMARVDNIKLKIYGDYFGETDYFNSLKEMAKDGGKVEFCGAYKYEEISDIMGGIDLSILPSLWWENSPLILLSSLSHRVPAIVSDLSGMTEIIKDGENGFTFPAGSTKDLAKVLQKIGRDPAILNELKANISRPPRIEEEAFEYEKIYNALLAERQVHPGN
jgi:glycosyltransferase involved in cell wall biosynthesis